MLLDPRKNMTCITPNGNMLTRGVAVGPQIEAQPLSPPPPHEMKLCTWVYGELPYWVQVNPPLQPPHFEKYDYTPNVDYFSAM